MALDKSHLYTNQITQDEHDDTANVELKKSGGFGWDSDGLEWKRMSVDTDGKLNVNAVVDIPPVTIDPTGLATDANQVNGSQTVKVVDGSNTPVSITSGVLDVNANLGGVGVDITSIESQQTDGSAKTQVVDAVNVNIDFATSAKQDDIITAIEAIPGGGGTQYTEGDVDATITGTAMLMEGATNTLLPIQGTVADGLLINLGSNNDVTVTGSVTANAGTNLNTSLLALESGGNLATLTAKDFATQTTLAALNAKVTAVNTGAVVIASGAVTETNSSAALTSLQLIDDSVYTDGTGTVTKGLAILGQDGTNPQAIKTDASGELQVDVLTMPTVAVTQSGTWDEVGINDSGNSITVDGTVAISNSSIPVTDNAGSLTVDNGGTFVVQENGAALTSLQLIDDVVYTDDTSTHATGSSKGALLMAAATPTDTAVNANDIGAVAMTTDRKLHVSIQDSLPAGTNAIGKLSANSGVDIGDIDITSIAAGDNNIGNVDIVTMPTVTVNAHAVTNAGTFATQDSQVIADNGAFTDGTSKVFAGGYIYDEVAGTALTENDVAAGRINVNRAIVGTIEDGATRGRYATVTASNAVKVDASGVAVPITDNSGSLTVDAPVGTPAFVRLSDGSSAITTLPVSLASVPSHAVTNAGTFVTQENGALLTSAQLIDDVVATLGTTTYTEATTKGNIIGAVRRDADTTLVDTTNEVAPLQLDARGLLKVEAFSGETLPVSLTSTTVTGTVAVTDNSGSLTVDNAGTFAVQVDGSALTSLQLIDDAIYGSDAALSKTMAIGAVLDDTGTVAITENQAGYVRMSSRRALLVEGVASGTAMNVLDTNSSSALTSLQLIDDTIIADDAAFTPAVSKVSMAGFQADETSTDSVDEGDAGAARMTLDRKIIATIQPHTAGGLDVGNFTSGDTFTALTSTAQAIKASAGKFYGYYIYNPNSSATYVIVYDIASGSVTVGTSTPKLVFCIPATSGANLELVNGITFSTAMSIAATTTGGGNTAPTTALEAMIWYK
jgi:hypothetical protein